MPYCPKCRYEYQPDVAACPDCGAELVEVLPEETSKDPIEPERRWKLLYNATARSAAEFLEGALKSAGVDCVVKYRGGYFGRAMAYSMGAITGVPDAEVYVPEEQFAKAEEIRQQTVGDDDTSMGFLPKD